MAAPAPRPPASSQRSLSARMADAFSGTWTCAQCTLQNPDSASNCQACNAARPARRPGSARPAPPRRPGSRGRDAASPARQLSGGMQGFLQWQTERRQMQIRQKRVIACFGLLGWLTGTIVGAALGALPKLPSAQAAVSIVCALVLGTVGCCFGLLLARRCTRMRVTNLHPNMHMELLRRMQEEGAGQVDSWSTRAAVAISTLPTHKVTSSEIASAPPELRECTICIEEFAEGDEQKTLPCFHRFHTKCIDTWLRSHGTCPMCLHRIDNASFQQPDMPGT